MARTSTNSDQLWLQVQMTLRAGDDEIKADRPHCLSLCTVLIASAKSTRRMHTTLSWGQGQVGVVFFRGGGGGKAGYPRIKRERTKSPGRASFGQNPAAPGISMIGSPHAKWPFSVGPIPGQFAKRSHGRLPVGDRHQSFHRSSWLVWAALLVRCGAWCVRTWQGTFLLDDR